MKIFKDFIQVFKNNPVPKVHNVDQDKLTLEKFMDELPMEKQNKTRESLPQTSAELQKFLHKNVPSAAQCVNKITESVLSNGICVVPSKQTGRLSRKQEMQLEDLIVECDLINVLDRYLKEHLIFGDGYMYPVPGETPNSIADIITLDTDKTSIYVDRDILDNSGIYKPTYYKYKIDQPRGGPVVSGGSGKAIYYNSDEIIRWTRPHVYDPVYGSGVLEDEQASLLFGIRILNHNLKFFQNSAKPPLVIELAEDSTKKSALEFKNYIDNFYKGSQNAWETMITYGGTKFTELSLPDQTQFMDFLTYVRIQTCSLFGVPPAEVGVVDKTGLNNAETQHKDFIKTNINKKKRILEQLLNYEIVRKRLKITDFQFHLPSMDAVNEKQRVELNALGLASGQYTFNEVRQKNNLSHIPQKWADELYVGDPKGIKGYASLEDVVESDMILGDASSNANPNLASGRPDLDGRDREPNESPESE